MRPGLEGSRFRTGVGQKEEVMRTRKLWTVVLPDGRKVGRFSCRRKALRQAKDVLRSREPLVGARIEEVRK